MKKWNRLEETAAPDGTKLSLWERDGDYTIRADGTELMTTRERGSEEKLAELGCAGLATKRGVRVLVGGLGFGFTLRAVLAAVPADAKVVVAELMEAVIAWNRNPDYPLAAAVLADKRVETVRRDVQGVIEQSPGGFDAILLDVDNGPEALTTAGNRRLYELPALKRAHRALKPGGRFAVWSVGAAPAFAAILEKAGFAPEVHRVRARGATGGVRTIFIGRV